MLPFLEIIQSADAAILFQIYQSGGNSFFDFTAILFSYIGTFRLAAILLGIFFWQKKETRQITYVLFASIIVSSLAVGFLKDITERPRPYITLGLTAADILVSANPYASFPSGHTANAFVTAAAVSYYFRKWLIPALLTAFVAGLSRIYLLVHYPSDVIAGAIIGISTVFVIILISKKLQKHGNSRLKDESAANRQMRNE
jgi:Membrane-associated phospholipid phosphatase